MPARVLKGRYRIISKLAKGGMGVTYRAWDKPAEVPVVVKMPMRQYFNSPGFLDRFDREIRTSAALVHPHVVPMLDHGTDKGEPFLVMRFLPGGSLSNRIPKADDGSNQPVAPAFLRCFLPGIASALDYSHSRGIVHRDVKPGNIFFDALSLAYLGDFGLVKILEESVVEGDDATLASASTAVGTKWYMAPERCLIDGRFDGRSDQYSLAITVHELLAGRRPFVGKTAHILDEHKNAPVPSLRARRPELPASLCDAVERALSKRPEDRFHSCADFAHAALRDVPALDGDPGYVRFLCPSCSRLLRLPESAAGQRGRCPNCREPMTIANDLAALWLDAEKEPRWEEPAEPSPAPDKTTSLPKTVASAALAAAAGLGAMFLLVILARFFR
ncbi:MAG: protein kinase domain-containing protein [Planctomycetia bacterium]|jgi:serine/threonine protein kinase